MQKNINKNEISKFDRYTGGATKTPDFTIFYNIAASNIVKFLHHNPIYEKFELGKIKRDQIGKNFEESTYPRLAEYLWKASADAKNSSDGYQVTEEDKKNIDELLFSLNAVRNYHSHIWHTNEALVFSNSLKKFVVEKYNKAMAACYEQLPTATVEFENYIKKDKNKKHEFFKTFENKNYLSVEGRIFLLGFFLTSGQMSAFLQQRKGSKRTDIPLFKIKHIAYKYYCHRDGASIAGFHQEEGILNDMTDEDRADVLKARQAYKLITYLHDYPQYLAEAEKMPLIVSDSGNEKKFKKISTTHELIDFIKARGFLQNFTFEIIKFRIKDDTDKKDQEERERTGTVWFYYQGIDNYRFQINFENLYKLVIMCLSQKDDNGNYNSDAQTRLKDKLQILADQRKKLYDILQRNLIHLSDEENGFLLNKENQYLRGNKKLTEIATVFFENFGKQLKISPDNRTKIANYIRPLNEDWERIHKQPKYTEHLPDPVIIYAHDFIEKTKQKFRAGNNFVFYASKYLIDYKIALDWHWEVEKFEMQPKKEKNIGELPNQSEPEESLMKIKEFHKEIPQGWRLSIENDHITIGILKDDTQQPASVIPSERHKKFYRFNIGTRALRYLMAFIIQNKNSVKVNDFLASAIKEDFKNLTENTWNGNRTFELLEEQYLPEYLKSKNASGDTGKQLKKIEERITFIIKKWDNALAHPHLLKRAEKNNIIMDGYRLFDWKNENDNVKFFRKQEYKQMSVCHYSLQEKEKSKFEYLYDNLFKLNRRKPPIPKEINDLLKEAKNLDDLMRLVIVDRKKYLWSEIGFVKGLPGKLRKEKIAELSRKLGLNMPPELLSEKERNVLQAKRTNTLQVLPFAIHPMLLLKYFEPACYKTDYKSLQKTPQQANGIFQKLRAPQYTQGLYMPHYDTGFMGNLATSENEVTTKELERENRKYIKTVHTTLTEDAILWWIAKQYLGHNNFTKRMAKALEDNSNHTLQVSNLYNEEIILELKKGTDKHNEDDTMTQRLYMSMKMHQLDDVMFATEEERLRRAAIHFLHRHNEEKEIWEIPSDEENDAENKIGSSEIPIPYETLRREMKLIAQNGKEFAQYLLDWERSIINGMVQAGKENDLIKESNKNDFIDFDTILKWSPINNNDTRKIIKDYRHRAFHNGIPLKWGSFAWAAKPGSELANLLRINEPLNQRKDRKKYD